MAMSSPIRRIVLLAALFSAAGLTACGGSSPAKEGAAMPAPSAPSQRSDYGDRVRARLIKNDSARIGDIIAWQGRNGLVIEIEAKALPPGGHGLHLHSRGECSDTGSFKASAGHVSKSEQPHGFLNPGGHHAGDLPNLYVHSDGTARLDLFTSDIGVADLMDKDGAAIIIHDQRDDYQTQPIGHAGARIACAAFTPRSN